MFKYASFGLWSTVFEDIPTKTVNPKLPTHLLHPKDVNFSRPRPTPITAPAR